MTTTKTTEELKVLRSKVAEQDQLISKLRVQIRGKDKQVSNLVYYEAIIATLPGHVYWFSKDMVALGCNDLLAKNCGLKSREDFIGKKMKEIVPEHLAEQYTDSYLKIMQEEKPLIEEEYGEILNGPAIYLSHKVPLKDTEGKIKGIVGISFDITKRKQMEEELSRAKERANAASEAKTQFILNMSHDIRTPFTGIIGSADLLKEQESDPKKIELLGCIADSGREMLELINDVIDEVCKDKEQQESFSLFNLKKILQGIQLTMAAAIRQKKLQLVINYMDDFPQEFMGNKLSLRQILINLVGNAIKFTEQGSIEITPSFEATDSKDITMLVLKIKDTGIGIPEDKQQVIFERFTRLTSSYNSKYEGNGLGLWKTKQIIEKLNGQIAVSSREGKGSTFTITIPLQMSSSEENKNQIEQVASSQPLGYDKTSFKDFALKSRGDKLYLLLVEDSTIASNVAKIMLMQYLDCEIDLASIGEQGISLANKNDYDLIVLDVGLPDQSGFSVSKKIREESVRNAVTPIVGLTAHYDHSLVEDWDESYFNMILKKPIYKDTCLKIAEFLKEKSEES